MVAPEAAGVVALAEIEVESDSKALHTSASVLRGMSLYFSALILRSSLTAW